MKTILTTLFLLITISAFCQLSTFDSDAGSGKLYEDKTTNGTSGLITILDYDVSKSEVGFSWNWNHKKQVKRCLPNRNTWSLEPSIGLNQETFTLFKEGVKPGGGLAFGYSNKIYCRKSDQKRILGFNRWVVQVDFDSKLLKNGVAIGDSLLETNKKWGSTIGANIGWGHVHEVPLCEDGNKSRYSWSIGFNLMPGYEFNSASHLDEALFCRTTGSRLLKESDSTYFDRLDCDELYDGQFKNSAYITSAIIFKKKIKSFSKSTNDEYLDLIVIPKVTLKENNWPRYDLALGFGLNKFPRTITTTLLFELQNYGLLAFKNGTNMGDVFSVNIYFGIPLGK